MDSRDFINKFDSQLFSLCLNVLDSLKSLKEAPNSSMKLKDFDTIYSNKNVALFAASIGLIVYTDYPKKYQNSLAETKIRNTIDGACSSFTGDDYFFINLYKQGITDIAFSSYALTQHLKNEEPLF